MTLAWLDTIDRFPGWGASAAFLEAKIREHGATQVADLGGGANPALPADFIRAQNLAYTVIDVSADELAKAPGYCRKVAIDISDSPEAFAAAIGQSRFDLMFSCMLLEHLRFPLVAHRNIYSALASGGLAIHLYASPCNVPLAVNRIVPQRVGALLTRLFQPTRDLGGHQVKFPAYYRMCGNPSPSLHRKFERLGYTVVEHRSYVGHGYYNRVPLLRTVEHMCRLPLVRMGIPLSSAHLLVLRKA